MSRQRALVIGPWISLDDGTLTLQVGFEYRCGCRDVSERPVQEIPPDPNLNLCEVRADPDVIAAIQSDSEYVVLWVEPDLSSTAQRQEAPGELVRQQARQLLETHGIGPDAAQRIVEPDGVAADTAEAVQARLREFSRVRPTGRITARLRTRSEMFSKSQ